MEDKKNKLVVAVCGSAGGDLSKKNLQKARLVGKLLAEAGVVVLAPGTRGYCYETGKAVRRAGGLVVGVSPAENREEHLQYYQSKIDAWDFVIFSGLGYKGRNVLTIQTADAVIFIGGGTGTLNEFTIAYDHHKPMGILKGVPGTMELVDQIVKKTYKKQPRIIVEEDPALLTKKVVEQAERYYRQTFETG